MYQAKTEKTCTINRPIQRLVPLGATNVNEAILDEEHDKPAGTKRLRKKQQKMSMLL